MKKKYGQGKKVVVSLKALKNEQVKHVMGGFCVTPWSMAE